MGTAALEALNAGYQMALLAWAVCAAVAGRLRGTQALPGQAAEPGRASLGSL